VQESRFAADGVPGAGAHLEKSQPSQISMGVMGLIPSIDSPSPSSALTALRPGRCSRAYSAVHHLRWSLRVVRCVPRRRVFRYAMATRPFFCRSFLNVISVELIIERAFFFAIDFFHFQSHLVWLSPACRSTFSTHVAPLLFSSALLRRIERDIVAVWIHDSWVSFCSMHWSTSETNEFISYVFI
jgi:hypothetical protein